MRASAFLRLRGQILVDPEKALKERDREDGAGVYGKGLDAASTVASGWGPPKIAKPDGGLHPATSYRDPGWDAGHRKG